MDGEVSLLQNDHGIMDMPVHKMDMLCRPLRRSSRASLNQAAPQASLGREGHAVHPWFFPIGQECPTPYLLCLSSMVCHHVPCHRSSRHLLPTLPVLHPLLLPLPEGGSLSRHPSPVHRLRMGPCRLAWAAEHADCLPDISLQAHPIKQAAQGTKCSLDPSWLQRLQPCHCPHIRKQYDAYPLVHIHLTLPRPPPSLSTSAAPPHPPTH